MKPWGESSNYSRSGFGCFVSFLSPAVVPKDALDYSGCGPDVPAQLSRYTTPPIRSVILR
jgi:hypothetical protein